MTIGASPLSDRPRISVLGFYGDVQALVLDDWAEMPAGSTGHAIRWGDWVVDSDGVAGDRPEVWPLPRPQSFATDGRLHVTLTYTIIRP